MPCSLQPAERYINRVQAGQYPAGRLVSLAIRRHLYDLQHAEQRGLYFDQEAAARACSFFPCVQHTTGDYAGQPFELRDFQAFIVAQLFGWRRKKDGLRRYRDAFVSMARGNGKSPFAAALALLLTFVDQPQEARAEGYCFATTRGQACIVFEEAKRMAEQSSLKQVLEIRANVLLRPLDGSSLKPLGSDSTNTDGLVPHCVILDELHEWREYYRPLWDKIETAMGKRAQPLRLCITTAGDENSHIWAEHREYAQRVAEQVESPPKDGASWFGDEFFSYLAEVDASDDIFDESTWPKANPMLCEPNSPVRVEHIRTLCGKARAGNVAAELRLRRYHGNQKVAGVEKPIRADVWARGAEMPEEAELADAVAFGGIDLARARDFAAVSLVFNLDDGTHALKTWAWTVQHRSEQLESAEFLALLKSPNLIVHPGNQIEFSDIRKTILDLHERYYVMSWAYDPSWATETAQYLQDEGLAVVEMQQNARNYNEPLVNFLDEIERGNVRHGGCRLLGWQAQNLVIKTNAQGLMMPAKGQSVNKIDSIVAALMAWREAMFSPAQASFYDTHGLEAG